MNRNTFIIRQFFEINDYIHDNLLGIAYRCFPLNLYKNIFMGKQPDLWRILLGKKPDL